MGPRDPAEGALCTGPNESTSGAKGASRSAHTDFQKNARLWMAPYRLQPRQRLSQRLASVPLVEGFLLRLEENGATGYASVQAWPSFGDPTADQLCESLRNLDFTNCLVERSLAFARRDAGARRLGESLWPPLNVPPSHFSWGGVDALQSEDFAHWWPQSSWPSRVCKLKLAPAQAEEFLRHADRLKRAGMCWRLDFNQLFDLEECKEFWRESVERQLPIEFIEDPVQDAQQLAQLPAGFPVAVDWIKDEVPDDFYFKALIVKPAREDVALCARRFAGRFEKLVVTSYMDHPLGQCHAAVVAAEVHSPDVVAGLNTHWLYQENEFSQHWLRRERGRDFRGPGGTGCGFDEILVEQAWQRLM